MVFKGVAKTEMNIMKFFIALNAIGSLISCIQMVRSIIASLKFIAKLKTIRYEISEDKDLYEKAYNLILSLILIQDFLWLLAATNRIPWFNKFNEWIFYATPTLLFISVGFTLVMLSIAQAIFILIKGHQIMWLKKMKIFF